MKNYLFITTLFFLAGCVPLVVGAAAGAGGYAWVQGKLVKEFEIPASRLHDETIDALKKLEMPVLEDESDRLTAKIRSEFSDGEKVTIDIEAVTEHTSKIEIRIGILGNRDRSQMIYDAVRKEVD